MLTAKTVEPCSGASTRLTRGLDRQVACVGSLDRAARVALSRRGDVQLGECAHAGGDRLFQEGEPLWKKELHARSEHGHVAHRPALRGKDVVASGDPRGRNASDPERAGVLEACLAIQDDQATRLDGMNELRRRRRGGDDDQNVAIADSVPAVNGRALVPAQERGDRRAAPLGLELGKALCPVAGASERVGQELRREHDPLAAPADKKHLLHAIAPFAGHSRAITERPNRSRCRPTRHPWLR